MLLSFYHIATFDTLVSGMSQVQVLRMCKAEYHKQDGM